MGVSQSEGYSGTFKEDFRAYIGFRVYGVQGLGFARMPGCDPSNPFLFSLESPHFLRGSGRP